MLSQQICIKRWYFSEEMLTVFLPKEFRFKCYNFSPSAAMSGGWFTLNIEIFFFHSPSWHKPRPGSSLLRAGSVIWTISLSKQTYGKPFRLVLWPWKLWTVSVFYTSSGIKKTNKKKKKVKIQIFFLKKKKKKKKKSHIKSLYALLLHITLFS